MDNVFVDVNNVPVTTTYNMQWNLTQKQNNLRLEILTHTQAVFPLEEIWVDYLQQLKEIQDNNRFRLPLNPYNFRDNGFKTPLLKMIIDASRTIDVTPDVFGASSDVNTEIANTERINTERINTKLFTRCNFRTWLTYRELYHDVLGKNFMTRVEVRVDLQKSKAVGRRKERIASGEEKVRVKGIPIRTFHVQDNSGMTVVALKPIIHKVEFATGSTLTWQLLSTYTQTRDEDEKCEHIKDKLQWMGGVDGDGCNLSNIRAWSNRIITQMKSCVDVIVINGVHNVHNGHNVHNVHNVHADAIYTCNAIGFALRTLTTDGCAMIALDEFHSPSVISCIHMFAMCFMTAKIIHIRAEDRLFLCGINFIGGKNGISSKIVDRIFAHGDDKNGSSIFCTDYMNGEAFTETVEVLLCVIKNVTKYRIDQYKKIVRVYNEIVANTMDNIHNVHNVHNVHTDNNDEATDTNASNTISMFDNNHTRERLRSEYPSDAAEWVSTILG